MQKESLFIRVPRIQGQKALALANGLGLHDRRLEIQKDDVFVHIPIIRQLNEEEIMLFHQQTNGFQIKVGVFQQQKRRDKTFAEALSKKLPQHLLASLPRAFDVVGDIAIIEISPELKADEKIVGEAILKTHKNIRTVLAKAGAVSGTYRLRDFEVIAGEPNTFTLYKEFGCKYYVDVAKAYFSPRLSHEHSRVAGLVEKGEVVVDLFAGVGPFSVLIAENKKAAKIFAIDINPEAFELLKKNIFLNRVQGFVVPILGEARKVVQDMLLGVGDRVIMNLPEKAEEFVDVGCRVLKPSGGVMHYYFFLRRPDSIEAAKLRFAESVKKSGRELKGFPSARTVRETAPYQRQIALDACII